MSVTITSGIALGFYVKREEIETARDFDVLTDELSDKYIINLNSWCGGDSLWKLCLEWGPEDGGAEELNAIDVMNYEPKSEELEEFYKVFPSRRGEKPKLYLFTAVW